MKCCQERACRLEVSARGIISKGWRREKRLRKQGQRKDTGLTLTGFKQQYYVYSGALLELSSKAGRESTEVTGSGIKVRYALVGKTK